MDFALTPLMTIARKHRLAQEVADTYRRALAGGSFYAAAWLLVGLYGGAFQRAPWPSAGLLLAFCLLAAARFGHRPDLAADAHVLERWLHLHWGIVLLTAGLWGLLFLWITLDPAFGYASTTALLFTLGLATAVAHVFSMRRGPAITAVGLMCLPGLAVMLWSDGQARANGLVLLVYLLYVAISLLRNHTEYQQRLDLDQELRSQRDAYSRQSRIDPLTDLANRRQFSNVLAAAVGRAQSHQQPLVLLLLDVDHFKQVNDTHGHAVGDACLLAIAARLHKRFSGEGDLAARVGGEEFGVVIEGQDLASTVQRAERFRANLVEHPIALDGIVLHMTASIGLAEFDPTLHHEVDALYHAADSAVYRAKAAGRNRVCQQQPELEMVEGSP